MNEAYTDREIIDIDALKERNRSESIFFISFLRFAKKNKQTIKLFLKKTLTSTWTTINEIKNTHFSKNLKYSEHKVAVLRCVFALPKK